MQNKEQNLRDRFIAETLNFAYKFQSMASEEKEEPLISSMSGHLIEMLISPLPVSMMNSLGPQTLPSAIGIAEDYLKDKKM